ncbi:MAG: hypothetical protein JXB15_16990, partial [Anaerolineales bacterium]|nr:hypothetical protein [Anaerolineales bacterium]
MDDRYPQNVFRTYPSSYRTSPYKLIIPQPKTNQSSRVSHSNSQYAEVGDANGEKAVSTKLVKAISKV